MYIPAQCPLFISSFMHVYVLVNVHGFFYSQPYLPPVQPRGISSPLVRFHRRLAFNPHQAHAGLVIS